MLLLSPFMDPAAVLISGFYPRGMAPLFSSDPSVILSIVCFFFFLQQQQMSTIMAAMSTTPPTMDPTIMPTLLDL